MFGKVLHREINGRMNYAGDGYDYRTYCGMRRVADNVAGLFMGLGTIGVGFIFEPLFLTKKDLPPLTTASEEVRVLGVQIGGGVKVIDETPNYPDAGTFIRAFRKKEDRTFALYQTCDLENDSHVYDIGPGVYTTFDVPSSGVMVRLYQNIGGKSMELLDYREIIWANQLSKQIIIEDGKTFTSFESRVLVSQRRTKKAADEISRALQLRTGVVE